MPEAFGDLWNKLVPKRGRADTVQGELVRIAGKIEYEFLDNGGMNWDEDHVRMLDAFRRYIALGNHANISRGALNDVIAVIKKHGRKGTCNNIALLELRGIAVVWCQDNPDPILLPKTEYTYER